MRPVVFVGLIICLFQSLILIHNIFNFEPESEYRNESDNIVILKLNTLYVICTIYTNLISVHLLL